MSQASRTSAARYSAVAIALHWAIAAAIVAQIVSGLWMVGAIRVPDQQAVAFQTYQWHKSLGLTVLVLSLVRLLWRLVNRPPPLPAHMGRLERLGAHTAHVLLYVLMIGVPLSGWALVSASPLGLPTIVFGQFEWPHIGWLAGLPDKTVAEATLRSAHRALAYATIALLGLHIAAALKHHLFDRDDVLARMLPLGRRRSDLAATDQRS